jgi:O-antigen ligase
MYLETSQLVHLAAALVATTVIFVAAYAAPFRVSVGILLALIPFQPIETSYGSANVLMTYVLAAALILRGRLRHMPTVWPMLAVLFAYLISVTQLPRAMYVSHGVEIVLLVSGFLVYVLAYNMAREAESPRFIVNLLVLMNLASVVYCLLQFTAAPGESLALFGIQELSTNRTRGGGDARLVGPFSEAGITAAYLMSMTLIVIYEALYSRRWRRAWLVGLASLNVAIIIATANRGSFLVLLASVPVFLYLFRAELGFARVVQILIASTALLAAMTAAIVTYTDYGQMPSRLETTTELEDGLPRTRAGVWPVAWESISEKPLLGHGPKLVQEAEQKRRSIHPEQLISPYPHNLYLYLLLTVGVLGTGCMLFFLLHIAWRIYHGARYGVFSTAYEKGWVLIGTLIVATFLVDELKIEFLRTGTVDYAHFVFALFGIFLGWADNARSMERVLRKDVMSRAALRPPLMASRTRL